MTTTTLPSTEVTQFASAVRSALSDLPPEELDELTDGLEADLSERLDETPDVEVGLGDPLAYAEELRAAAGYPPRTARSHLGAPLPNLSTWAQSLRAGGASFVASNAWLGSTLAFFAVLRPVWWVFRGVAAHVLLAGFLGYSGTAFWPIAVVLVVLSVQIGRGRMLSRPSARWATRVVSAIAILAAPILLGSLASTVNTAMSTPYSEPEVYYPQQLTADGLPIFNVFAYDADGNPIEQVQLFDQDGNPLDLVDGSNAYVSDREGGLLVPNEDVPGRAGWNVFPLGEVDAGALDLNGNLTQVSPHAPVHPFPTVKPLSGHSPLLPLGDGSPQAGPTASPAPKG